MICSRSLVSYGMSSTLLAAGSFGGAMSLANLASAAESTYERRFRKPAKHTLKFGAAGFNARNLLIERAGALEFARDLESRTDGEIRIEFIGDNQICGQTSCVEKTQQGIVDIYAASTQNSAGWCAIPERVWTMRICSVTVPISTISSIHQSHKSIAA